MKRIILRDWESRAFHAGRLTQLRGSVKTGSLLSQSDGYKRRVLSLPYDLSTLNEMLSERQRDPLKRFCPLGGPGSRLWVAETYLHETYNREIADSGEYETVRSRPGCTIEYVADGAVERRLKPTSVGGPWMCKYPPVTMPRWASRSIIEITAVRVERVQDVTEEEAIKLGCECMLDASGNIGWHGEKAPLGSGCSWINAAKHRWIANHGQASWGENPWVWVRDVRRVESITH